MAKTENKGEANVKKEFSLKGIKDKKKQKIVLENRISELEKELKNRKNQLEKVNKNLLEEEINKLKEQYSIDDIREILDKE